MADPVYRILGRHSEALANQLAMQLTSKPASSYRDIDPRQLVARCRRLVDALVNSAREREHELAEYVGTVGDARLADGVRLDELQRALRILESNAWRVVVRASPAADLHRNLAGLNLVLGRARDELARTCLLRGTLPRSALKRVELEELFKGTERIAPAADSWLKDSGDSGARSVREKPASSMP